MFSAKIYEIILVQILTGRRGGTDKSAATSVMTSATENLSYSRTVHTGEL